MVHYKLTYFNARGFGEPIRYILAYGGQDFEDVRVSLEQWKENSSLKSKTPMGQLPVLEIDGQQTLCQSSAICRFLANQFGIAGSNLLEQAQVDMFVDGWKDMLPKSVPWYMEYRKKHVEGCTTNDDAIEQKFQAFKSEALIPFLDQYEKFLANNGTGVLVGSKVTWADLVIAEYLHRLISIVDPQLLANHSKIDALVSKVHELPGIKEYLAKRPHTLM